MNQEEIDPFIIALNKWKARVEQLALFLFLILHLLLMGSVVLTMLWAHFQDKSATAPEVERPHK
jgi:hypothetical protein